MQPQRERFAVRPQQPERIDAVPQEPQAHDDLRADVAGQRHHDRDQRRDDHGRDHLGNDRGGVRDGQRFPEQDAAVPAVVVKRAQQVKEHHEEQHDR